MSTAIAPATAAPLPPLDRNPSPRSYPPLAPSFSTAPPERTSEYHHPSENGPRSVDRTPSDGGRQSPRSSVRSGGYPKITVKKEPASSPLQAARHRPRKLDLNTSAASSSTPGNTRPSATPMTARDSLSTLHDVGLACLSPGFQTQDPTMREQLQRSLSVRDQQRSIIESRLLKSAKGDHPDASRTADLLQADDKGGPATGKKRPPPGLSIVPPPAERFANERVVQSAPLNQTFTGRHDPHQPHRQSSNLAPQPSMPLGPPSHAANRLPPINDVFGANEFNPNPSRPPFLHANSTPGHVHGPPMPSPSFPPQTAHPMSYGAQSFERPREYRSAEEAVRELTGGREELRPKIVHYGVHQPPTPPSPHPQHSGDSLTPFKHQQQHHGAGRRRSRNEYEADSSPPLGTGRGVKFGPFGEGRDSPATQKAKKEEFLSLCSRAWDLFHS